VNARIGGLDAELAEAIQQAAGEVASGSMTINSACHLADRIGHPVQHERERGDRRARQRDPDGKARRQEPGPSRTIMSTRVSRRTTASDRDARRAARAVQQRLLPRWRTIHKRLAAQAQAWDGIVKIGRTHLQDATPLTLGQEVFRLCGADRGRDRPRLKRDAAPSPACTGRDGGRHRPQRARRASARLSPRRSPTSPSCRSRRRRTSSRSWPPMILWWSFRACSTCSPCLSPRSPTTFRLLGSGPRSGLAELRLPETSPAARSCLVRSTPPRPRC
jgi:fumarate hydratase class II